jgi:hypothetical protein
MRVTLKTVNEKLAELGMKAELAKGAGYFLFRGGEADDWIDRTVAVPTISSLTLEEWLNEYKRLKTLNGDMLKAAKHAPPKPAKTQQSHDGPHREARTDEAPTPRRPDREAPIRDAQAPAPPARKARAHEQPNHPATIHEAPAQPAPAGVAGSIPKEACGVKTKLPAELDHAHEDLVAIEEQRLRAAGEGRVSDLVTLSAMAARERAKFDRALLAIRDHALVHGC